jgi:putative spermidine/putrescine transport system ATP-binding protein
MSAFLILDHISKRYGMAEVIRDVSLNIDRGCFLTLLGPSGSGKTTLLMMVAGFVEPSAGEVRLDGRVITRLQPDKRNFGMVFQGYALFQHMTVSENVAFSLKMRGRSAAERREAVSRALDMVQMSRFADRMPKQLSGGQQQRVAIARALAFEPALLLLDEPLSALDKKLRLEVQGELRALHQRLGMTFICVTHDQEEALSLSDEIAILRDGRVEQIGAPRALYEQPRSRFVADFLGRSNFLPVTVTRVQAGRIECDCAGTALIKSGDVAGLQVGQVALMALRPESLRVMSSPAGGEQNTVEGRIHSSSYAGSLQHIVVTTRTGTPITATISAALGEAPPAIDALVWLGWDYQAGVILHDE